MILTDISLKRPVFATVTILALVMLGFVSYLSLNVDEYPDVEFPFVTVRVNYTGANPEQVDSKIIQKVEDAVSSVPGVKHISSSAREGVAFTFIEFSLETSPSVAAQDVRDKIGRIRGELPDDADEPIIMRYDPTQAPIASLAVVGNMSVREMTTLVDDVIKKRLETVNGVGAIDVQGSLTRQINIMLNKDKVAAHSLAITDIVTSLSNENLEVPGGKITNGNREVNMRTMGNVDTAQGFLQAPIARKDGVQLYVKDIATVTDGTEEATSIAKLNGEPAISLDITKQSGANTVKVVNDVKKVLADINKDLPVGVKVVMVRDNSVKILDSIHDVLFNLVLGGLLAVVIVFVFLGNWRSTLISGITIPASIIATFFTMKMLGYTLNTMSLMALSLAVGILIDDAIVVIENIVRHMEMGKSRLQAAAEATQEIGLAVTATTLTLVAVFTPVGMMTGIVGQFFKQFGITVAFAVMVSLLIAFTLTPMLSANYLDIGHGRPTSRLGRILYDGNQKFDQWTERYSRFLQKALHRRWLVIGSAVLLFILSLGLTTMLGSDFMTKADRGEFSISADVDSGTSVAGAAAIADQMSELIRQIPEVVLVKSTADTDTIKFYVKTTDKNQRKRSVTAIMNELRGTIHALPGIKAAYLQSGGVADEYPVQVVIKGESLDTLSEIAEQAKRIMEETPGAQDVISSYKPGKPDAQVVVRRDQAADSGVSTASIANTLRIMFNGYTVGQFKDGDDRYDVRVRLQEDDRRQIRDLNGIYLASQFKDQNDKAVMVPLSQLTQAVYSTSPSEIQRYDRQRQIKLTANLSGTSLGEYNKALFEKLNRIQMPSGYGFVAIGESERMGDTFSAMGIALLLAVSFIFFVLAAQFESYIDPFSIMLSLPLAVIGAIGGLLVMRSTLSIMSMIGIIMLMGLVTKNAILLIDFAKQRMSEGLARNEALVEAARIRMRPIMMTTAAMIFGMLPLAIGFGPGAEARAPMAHAIIGGLVTSTLLTLVVVPVVYSLLDDLKHKLVKDKATQSL